MTSETRPMRVGGRIKQVDGFTCAACGVWGPYGEFHPWLFCELHKRGWSREQIIENLRWCAEELGWLAGPEETELRQAHEDFAKAYPITLDEAVEKLRAYPHDPEEDRG